MNTVNRSLGHHKAAGTSNCRYPFRLDLSAFLIPLLSFVSQFSLELLLLLFLPQSNSLQSLFVRNPFIRSRGRCIMLPKTRLGHYKLPAFELKS
jgi:hypothetical protein